VRGQEERKVSGSDWLVLVVEDEAPIRRFLKTALEAQGFKLLEAPTGTQAMAMAASHNPDVILLDLGLPDIDGLEVIMYRTRFSGHKFFLSHPSE
jgi:two-component system, OmpR family, KDP operon response regulator KdpE